VRHHFVRLGKQTLIYGLGAVAQQILGVITLPIYARVFAPSEYGVIEVLTVGLAVLAIVVDFGLNSAAQRSYFDYTDDDFEKRRVVLSTSIGSSMSIALPLAVGVAAASQPIAVWLFGSDRYATTVVLAAACVPAGTLATLLQEVTRLRFQPWRYLTVSLISGGIGTALALTFVLAFGWGVNGVFAGMLTGSLAAAGYGLAVAHPYIGRRISRPELRVMVAFGLPLIPVAGAMWMLQFVDRILLTKLGSLDDVGQYAVANRLSFSMLLLVSAFSIAYAPFMLSLHAEDAEAERVVRARLLTYLTAGLVVLAVVFSLFAREIIAIIAPGYHRSYQAVALVCAGTAALGFCQIPMAGISISRRTKLFAYYSTIAAVVNLGLNFLLIPAWGQIGAAAATAIGYLLLALLYYRGAQRVEPTPYATGKLIATAGLGAVLMPIGLIPDRVLWLALLVKLGALVVLVIGLRVIGVVGPEELGEVRALIARGRNVRPVSA
jgi:O-antigen/teichoic acid export membrane protein